MTPRDSVAPCDTRPTGPAGAAAVETRDGLRVRRAAPADHPAVLALLRRLDLDWPTRDLASFWVAESRGEVVGVADLRTDGDRHLLSGVGVREDLQGHGVGRKLVEGVLAGATGDVHLYTLIPGFFAGLGFVEAPPAPAALPRERIYDCGNCDPSRCRSMVLPAPARALPDDGPLRAEHLPALAAVLRRSGEPTCDLSVASLWIWRDCEAPHVRRVQGSVCIRLDPHHEPAYHLEPLGDFDGNDALDVAGIVETCLAETGRLSRVRTAFARRVGAGRFDVVPLRDHFDYVYDRARLVELRGAVHRGHRNRIHKFEREHPRHEVRPLTADDRDAALAVFDRWAAEAAGADGPAPRPSLPALACQRRAIGNAFEDFATLRLTGCALVDDGAFAGFLVGSRSGDTAIAHFKYADQSLPGAAQTLLVESCRRAFADQTWIDLEEDLGLPGLRRMKSEWEPARLVEKFQVTRRG